MDSKFRLYIDEVGDPGLKAVNNPKHRYLSLTGVIMELGYVQDVAFPRLEDLKRKYFRSHVDDPVILHRKELINQKHPFQILRDPKVRKKFDRELLKLLSQLQYSVITVIIDKLEHKTRYSVWQYDPYHYCLKVMLERYVLFLPGNFGGIIAEILEREKYYRSPQGKIVGWGRKWLP